MGVILMARSLMRMYLMINPRGLCMPNLNRRHFLIATASGAAIRSVPLVKTAPGKRVLTLVFDKSLGMMRAVDRVVR